MKTALYYRVSTDGQSVDAQKQELRKICESRGWPIVAEYSDIMSGSRLDRDGLNHMLQDAASKAFECIMCIKIDRLARSLTHFVNITQQLEDLGVALIVPGQNIDTSDTSPCGKLQRQLLAAVAEFERSLIKERVKAGFAAAKAKGKVFGKPSKNLVHYWRDIIKDFDHGTTSYRQLADDLGGVSVSTAYRLAKEGA